MKPYVIHCNTDISVLEHKVLQSIKDGYTPQGGVTVDNADHYVSYIQAMYKKPTKTVKSRESRSQYPLWFEDAWKAYPKRSGSNPKGKAYSAWLARLKERRKAEPDTNKMVVQDNLVRDSIFGLDRYCAYCEAMDVPEQYVLMAATFFGPDKHYENDWTAPTQAETMPKDNDQLVNWATQKGYRAPRPGESFAEYRRAVEALYRQNGQ